MAIVSCAAPTLRNKKRGDRASMPEITPVEDPPVAVNVTRRIKPGRIGEFEDWVSGITDAISRFPGFLGAEVLKPGDPSDSEYHIIFKFERLSDLQRWEDSEERRDWCGRVEAFQEGPAERHVVTGLDSRGGSCYPRAETPFRHPATSWSRSPG